VLSQLETFLQEVSAPIPGDEPFGEDPKYEDTFAWLKEEIAKMGGMGAGATDWDKVELESRRLLTEQAKDLNLIAYLMTAWVELYKGEGLIVGLEVLMHFLGEDKWPEIFPKPIPKKNKARGLSLAWLQTQIGDRLLECSLDDRDLVTRGLTAVESIKDRIYAAFEDPPANFKGIRNTLEEWLAQIPEPEPEPEEPETETEEDAEQAEAPSESDPDTARVAPKTESKPRSKSKPKQGSTVQAPTIAEDADAEALYEVLAKVARQLGEQDPDNPLPYLLSRMALWSGVELPRHEESKETFFPSPPDEVVDSLKNMASKAAWDALLAKVEDLTIDRWFWLDLQYYASRAAQGKESAEIAEIIESRTHRLVESLPELADLKFNDGTPFASAPTRDWLKGLGSRGGGGGGEPDPAETLLSEMRQMGESRFTEAMAAAQASIRGAGSGRMGFRMRLEAARFCVEAGQFYWAESLAESLVEAIEQHDLATWEPELAGVAWSVLIEVARELKESEERYAELERRAMRALAGLDLASAGRYPKSRPTYA